MTQPGATILCQCGPRSNSNEGILCILQTSSITVTSTLDFLVLYPGHSLEDSYPSEDHQSVYSAAPADWNIIILRIV